MENLKLDNSTGYLYFCDKNHPMSFGNSNRVYYHRHVLFVHLGRVLTSDEHVHHIDGNKLNNNISNLEIVSNSEHISKHRTNKHDKICPICFKEFETNRKYKVYCSRDCVNKNNIKNKVTKEELEKLIPFNSWKSLGKLFGYSDIGIKKRAIALGCKLK